MRSGNICAMPDCRKSLTADSDKSAPAVLGEAAHIYGENPGSNTKPPSARYLSTMTDYERNHYDNLIYLCPTCHTKIDKQENDYSADYLKQLKREHEQWVSDQLDMQMNVVSFAELEIASKAIASGQHVDFSEDFFTITPSEKIDKNNLSQSVRSDIAMGLSKSKEVEKFLANMAMNVDGEFPERLKNGFKTKYEELKEELSGDELFASMLEYSQAGQKGFKQQAASLAVLSHLFHICEVFEK